VTPESRKDQLLAQEVGQELVVYDQQTHTAHRLNRTAAMVWRLADGKRSVGDIASIVHDTVDLPGDEEAEELVRVALKELDGTGLLVRGLTKADEPISRRRMLVMAAALVPVVTSIAVPAEAGVCTPLRPCTLTTVTPNSGPLAGGTLVTVAGTGFENASTTNVANGVTFGGVAGTNFSRVSATQITVRTPAGIMAGPVTVAITASGSDSNQTLPSLSAGFTYISSFNQTYAYTGANQTLVVPAGVTSLVVDAYGAQGAPSIDGTPGVGGLGARVQTTIAVTPGETLDVIVGGSGTSGGFGGGGPISPGVIAGGGGGLSGIFRMGTPLVVAAGGGGGGTGTTGGAGGAGGGETGADGGAGFSGSLIGGGGGTQLAGGTAGAGLNVGLPLQGGPGDGGTFAAGGGGGGGFFGGGGGAGSSSPVPDSGSGGGGGSSYSSGTGTTHTRGARSGDGVIMVTQGL
jgi:hypothetical protein